MSAQPHSHHEQGLAADPAERLRQLLVRGYVDEHTQERHPSLLDWYPTVVAWSSVRDGRGGGGSGGSVPLNVAAIDFCSRSYWAAPDIPMPGTEQANNPDHYRPGFEVTVLGLSDTARRALGTEPAIMPRDAGASHLPRPDVQRALRWLALRAQDLWTGHPQLALTIEAEANRLLVRVYAMAWGSSRDTTHSQCPYCHQVESVWSDGSRAVCITPTCRRPDGQRRCWQVNPADDAWHEVEEPDADGLGRLTDDALSRWTSG